MSRWHFSDVVAINRYYYKVFRTLESILAPSSVAEAMCTPLYCHEHSSTPILSFYLSLLE